MCHSTFQLKTPKGIFNIGCGKCYPCKQKRKRNWTFRLHHEFKSAKSAAFITLTYNDESIPVTDGVEHLFKRDLQLFIKQLRNTHLKHYKTEYNFKSIKDAQKNAPQVRYFACGEYGEKTLRPHYHILLFNYPTSLYNNLAPLWNKGHVHIGDVNNATIAYTAKYIMKGKNEVHDSYPMFNTMSKKPPIGHTYFKMEKWHRENKSILCKDQNGNLMLLPRIFRDKFFTEIEQRALLKKHFIEYEANLLKEEKRLSDLGNELGQLEYSLRLDELRRLNRLNKQEKI